MPGTENPVNQIGGIDTATPVIKADFVSWAKARVVQLISNATELRTFDLSSQLSVILKSNGRVYNSDTTDTTTADDGVQCIRDFNGLAFKLVDVVGLDGSDGSDAGIRWLFDSSTSMADPGSGDLRLNNASLASVTAAAISASCAESGNPSVANFVKAWDDSTTTSLRGFLVIKKITAPQNFAIYSITAAITDNTTWLQATLAHVSSSGSFAASDALSVQFFRTGDQGAAGSNGSNGSNGTDPGIRWLFDSSTTMADPGSGDLRLNNATLSSVTAIAISDNSGETGNPSVDAFIGTWDDSTTTSLRGFLILKKASAPQNFAIYSITAALTDNTTWWQITVSHVASSGSFSNTDVLSVQFYRTGNAGAGSGDLLAANNLSDLASPKTGYDNISVHGADVASADTIDLDAATGNLIDVTGTTTITAITLANGRFRTVRFTGALTLTNGASLVLPGGKNITTAAGDFAIFRGYAAGVVRCVAYVRADGQYLDCGLATIASAGTTELGSVLAETISISGTTTITSFGSTAPTGDVKFVRFEGALTFTHNATSLILPGGANITTAAGDCAIARHEGSGNWRVLSYMVAANAPGGSVSAASQATMEAASSTTEYSSPGRQHFHPGHPKAWGVFHYTSSSAITADAGYGVTSYSDGGSGDTTVNLSVTFSSSVYCVFGGAYDSTNLVGGVAPSALTATTITLHHDVNPDSSTPTINFAACGDF